MLAVFVLCLLGLHEAHASSSHGVLIEPFSLSIPVVVNGQEEPFTVDSQNLTSLLQLARDFCQSYSIPPTLPCAPLLVESILPSLIQYSDSFPRGAFPGLLEDLTRESARGHPSVGVETLLPSLLEIAWGWCYEERTDCPLPVLLRLLETGFLSPDPEMVKTAARLYMAEPLTVERLGLESVKGVLAELEGRWDLAHVAYSLLTRPGPFRNRAQASEVGRGIGEGRDTLLCLSLNDFGGLTMSRLSRLPPSM